MRRVQRDIEHEDLVKHLTSGDGAIFPEIWRLLLFAAMVGIHRGARTPLQKVDSGKSMPEGYFSSPGWRGLLFLISLVETDSSDCLRNTAEEQDSLIRVFEEYANHGLYVLRDALNSAERPLDVFVALLLEIKENSTDQPDLSGLI